MKLSPRLFVWFQALVVIGCFSVLKAETKPSTYVAADVTGTVTWTNPETQVVAPLTSGKKLPQGAIVTTGPDSSVILIFASGATATLSADTSMEVSRFYQQAFSDDAFADDAAEPSVSVTELNLIRGEMTGQVRRLRTGSEFVVNTPVGAAGVRGTEFSVSYDPATKEMVIKTATGLVVYKGTVGAEVPVGANEGLTVINGETGAVRALTIEELKKIVKTAEKAVEAALKNEEKDKKNKPTTSDPITITIKNTDEVSGSQP